MHIFRLTEIGILRTGVESTAEIAYVFAYETSCLKCALTGLTWGYVGFVVVPIEKRLALFLHDAEE